MLCIRYPVAVNYSIMRLLSLCTTFCTVWRKWLKQLKKGHLS